MAGILETLGSLSGFEEIFTFARLLDRGLSPASRNLLGKLSNVNSESGNIRALMLQDSLQQIQQLHIEKALEAAVSFSQSLSQWAYIVLAGSVALLYKDLKSRSRLVRHSFWAFIPGWVLLGFSIYEGMRVQSAYVAYLMNPNRQLDLTILGFNRHANRQSWSMKWGLLVFALWLLFFLICWITQQGRSEATASAHATHEEKGTSFRSFDA